MSPKEEEKVNKAINECYCRLYKSSVPSADFNKLMEDAPKNSLGQKVIQFWNYEIDKKTYADIIEDVAKSYKFKGYKKQQFKNTISLGCSPKFKKDEVD